MERPLAFEWCKVKLGVTIGDVGPNSNLDVYIRVGDMLSSSPLILDCYFLPQPLLGNQSSNVLPVYPISAIEEVALKHYLDPTNFLSYITLIQCTI